MSYVFASNGYLALLLAPELGVQRETTKGGKMLLLLIEFVSSHTHCSKLSNLTVIRSEFETPERTATTTVAAVQLTAGSHGATIRRNNDNV